jgi:hypothetical protein
MRLETGKICSVKKCHSHMTEEFHTMLNPKCSCRQIHTLNLEVTAKCETVLLHSQTFVPWYHGQGQLIPLTILGHNSLLLSAV